MAAEPEDTARQAFVEMDGEIQSIKQEILDLNRDIRSLEELALFARGQELVVLVSLRDAVALQPETISLQLDGQEICRHRYSASEGDALREGGVQRLYAGRLPGGEHRLEVSVRGTLQGRSVHQQRGVTLTRGPGRQYLDVQLGPGADRAEPGLVIREW